MWCFLLWLWVVAFGWFDCGFGSLYNLLYLLLVGLVDAGKWCLAVALMVVSCVLCDVLLWFLFWAASMLLTFWTVVLLSI